MTRRSWQLDRKTFLRGSGIALSLPWLEAMASKETKKEMPKRFCSVYFPYGAFLPKESDQTSKWSWLPLQTGKDYKFTEANGAMKPFKNDVTFIRGLSHPRCRKMGGHDTADTFLTGTLMKAPDFSSGISLDQVIANEIATETRYRGMALSTDGGVGSFTRSHTLSYTDKGYPIPSLNSPKQIFARMFDMNSKFQKSQKKELNNTQSALDLLMDHSKSLSRKLGKADQQKMEEYLYSVRAIEKRIQNAKNWLDVPLPKVDKSKLALHADKTMPKEYIQCMLDLIVMAFQTDVCRVATYQIGSMNGATSIAGQFPVILGLTQMHKMAHSASRNAKSGEQQGKWDKFLFEQMAYFFNKLKNIREGNGTLLDNTIILYGTSNSKTHNNNNYPLLVAGGNKLGMKHGQSLSYKSDVPMSNLLLSIQNKLIKPRESFSDSKSELKEIV